MWMSRYSIPIEITYDQRKEFIGREFIKYLIETKYGITAKPRTLGNPVSNVILERIHHVLGSLVQTFNIQQTYVDKNDPWTSILASAAFVLFSTTSGPKCYIPGQLIFGRDMILLIKHRVDWEFIRHQKQTQINRGNTRKNKHRVDYDYKVRDKFMLLNHTEYKYETPYKGPFFDNTVFYQWHGNDLFQPWVGTD